MKSAIKNKNENISSKNTYEEISDFSETLANGAVIDGAENFGEDSVVELDLIDFEEFGGVKNAYLKSMTIIDEFENDFAEKYNLPHKFAAPDNEFNLELLTNQIDSLISVQKRKEIILPPKKIFPGKATIETLSEEEEQTEEISQSESAAIQKTEQIPDKQVIKEIIPEVKSDKEQRLYEQENENAKLEELEKIEDNVVERVLKKLETQKKEDKEKRKNYIEVTNLIPEPETPKINHALIYEDNYDEHMTEDDELTDFKKEETFKSKIGNSITIEIPDKLLKELPAGFNIDELGMIDLKEAEIIAEEGLLFLAKGDLLKQLEGLNILPDQNAEQHEEKDETQPETKTAKAAKTQKKKTGKTDVNKEDFKEDIKEESKKIQLSTEIIKIETIDTKEEKNEIEDNIVDDKVIDGEDTQEFSIYSVKENAKFEILDIPDETPPIKAEAPVDTSAEAKFAGEVQFDYVPVSDERKDENVFIIESTAPDSVDNKINISNIDELETITSGSAEAKGGKPRQLTEAEESIAPPAPVVDNYNAVTDSSNDIELNDPHLHVKDDIAYSDDSIPSAGQQETMQKAEDAREKDETESNASQYEKIFGPTSDESKQSESRIIDDDSILPEPMLDKAAKDQYNLDTDALTRYKYILPSPDSLLDDEKKSIEEDISGDSALIFEEDVTRIKKKLDDSTKKEIADTIHDITDRVTILEENINNKEANADNQKDKEEIKKLLGYLDKLFEKLPEENIKNFADSEYYELYKKLL